MSIVIVPVTVPPFGDGPIADISALVGKKTVTLTGFFEGAYVLLASHNDATFDPLLTFNSDGRENIKVTLPDAYKSVRIRSAVITSSAVSAQVTGISAPGQNLFATLATFLPGAGGSSTVFDTASLFPPSGLETDINIMCAGGLEGDLVVEGSQNGADFNPIGSFQAGSRQRQLLGGLPPALEFNPLSTSDNTRYLRFTLNGQVTSDLTLTVGGSIETGSSGSGKSLLVLNEDEGRSVTQGPTEGDPTEAIVYEWMVNLSDLATGNISAQMTAIIKSLDASHDPVPTATFNLYVGSTTPGDTTGSTLLTTISTSNGSYVLATSPSAPFVNLETSCLAQVTAQTTVPANSGELNQAVIRGITVVIG